MRQCVKIHLKEACCEKFDIQALAIRRVHSGGLLSTACQMCQL